MKYPNLRYGNPNELRYYITGISVKEMAKRLKHSERSINNYLSQKTKIPWWIPEILRLQRMEAIERTRQMNMTPIIKRYNLKTAKIINFRLRNETKKKQDQNLDALDATICDGLARINGVSHT